MLSASSSDAAHERVGPAVPVGPSRWTLLGRQWPILVPLLLYASSGIYVLATNYWTTEQGGHGPIILVTGLWLLWQKSYGLPMMPGRERRFLPALAVILTFGLASVAAAITVKQYLQVTGIYVALVALLWYYIGTGGLRRLWAPVLYLAFLIPPPEGLIVPLTRELRHRISLCAVELLDMLHYPVAREGPTIFIGPYELVVAAACSGLNSLVSLLAIGLFYTYLMHPNDKRYALVLSLFLIPIAVFANFVRVLLLLLLTYYFGDAVGQSVLHDAMGLIVFAIALATLFALDTLLHPLFARRGARARAAEVTSHG